VQGGEVGGTVGSKLDRNNRAQNEDPLEVQPTTEHLAEADFHEDQVRAQRSGQRFPLGTDLEPEDQHPAAEQIEAQRADRHGRFDRIPQG